MAQNGIVAAYDDIGHPSVARLAVSWAFGTGALAIAAAPGRLCRVHVTTALTSGTSATVLLYDNASAASGNVLWELVTSSSLNVAGGVFAIDLPAFNGIYLGISGALTAGALTIGYC
jgi:hypothetical protein